MTTPSGNDAELARKAHRTIEPMHAATYFAPEPRERISALGIKGGMRAYFAARSAPFGIVPAEVVTATFYNFNPALVAKAIPSVWDVTTPEAVTAARYEAVSEIYRRVLGADVLDSAEMKEAADLAREATTVLTGEGRPLYAAHAALAWPDPTHLQLFHALTLLREHRGDGHIAALVLAELDPVEALASYVPLGTGMPEVALRASRGWSDEEWDAADARLRERGLLDADRAYTPTGRAQRDEIERQTDTAAAAPYRHLGADRTNRLRDIVRPWSTAMTEDMFRSAA